MKTAIGIGIVLNHNLALAVVCGDQIPDISNLPSMALLILIGCTVYNYAHLL